MDVLTILFYAISAFILVMGLMAVTSTRIFRSAIWLLLSLVGIAMLYFWMQVEFIAAIQIIVYVGGIVVLIIFSIFLTQESGRKMPKPSMTRIITSALAAIFGFAFSFNVVSHYGFTGRLSNSPDFSVNNIGTQLLSTTEHGYILPFEVVSVLLLSAMIGCIVIAMKPAKINSENNDPKLKKIDANIPEPLITEEV